MYSVRLPPVIHSEMSWRGIEVIPRRGTMFGWSKRFHTTAPWKNTCMSHQRRAVAAGGKRAFVAFFGPSFEYTRMRFTQTLKPLNIPLYTSPGPPEATGSWPIFKAADGMAHGVGNINLMPHMLLSSCRHARKPELDGSRLSSAYAGLSRRRDGYEVAYLV